MTVAIFPGSFDPITNGHVDLVNRAVKMFDKIIVAVLTNPAKTGCFQLEERLEHIAASVPEGVEVASFQGLLVDFARSRNAGVIIRGLRAVSDFEYELQMTMMNRNLDQELETVFLTTQSSYSFLSSRLVKEVAGLGGDISNLVPPIVDRALKEKFGV